MKYLKKNRKVINMKKIALIFVTLFILIVGISCASAAAVNHGTGSTIKKDYQGSLIKTSNSAVKDISKKATVKKAAKKTTKKAKTTKKVTKKAAKKTAKKTVKKATVKKATKKVTKKAAKKTTKKVATKTTVRAVDKVINGWNPKEHQVSKQSLGGGLYRVNYDDGYHRIIDSKGNILSYGY